MNPELKAYLDKLRAETKALYDAWNNQFELRATLPTTGALTPPPTRSVLAAADGGLTDNASVPAVVPDVFTATNQAQVALAVAHDASPVCIEMAPVTCSTECPSRDTTASTSVFTLGTTPTSATATIDVTPVLAASVVTNDFTTPSRLLQAAAPALTHELKVLRPRPWPSFKCHLGADYHEESMSELFDKSQDATATVKEHKDAQEFVIPLPINPSAWYEQPLIPQDMCFISSDAHLMFDEYTRNVKVKLRPAWPSLLQAHFCDLRSLRQLDTDPTIALFPWNPGGYLPRNRNQRTMVFTTASSGSHWPVSCVIVESWHCSSEIAKNSMVLSYLSEHETSDRCLFNSKSDVFAWVTLVTETSLHNTSKDNRPPFFGWEIAWRFYLAYSDGDGDKFRPPLSWPSFKCSQTWTLLQPEEFRSLLMITSAGTTGQQSVGEQSIIPMSTSSWLLQVPSMDHADGHEVQPMSWPPFDCSHGGAHLKHAGPLPQATSVMKFFSGELTSLRESLRYLQCVQPNPCTSEKVACWISHGPRAVSIPSQLGIQLIVIYYVQSAYDFFARDTQASCTRMPLASIKLWPWPMLEFNHGKCPVMIVRFTSTSGNTELQSTPKHLKKSVHWQSLGEEELEGSGTCTSDTMLTEGKEVIITMLSTIIYCCSTVSDGQTKWPCTFGTDKKKPWPPPQGLLSNQSTGEPHGYFFLDTICHALHARSSLSEYYAQVPWEQASQDWTLCVCNSTVHINDSAQRWVFGISASTRIDAWINSRFNGTNCRATDTATGLLKLYVDFGNFLPRNSLSPKFAGVEIWQYLSDGPPLLLWPPTSQEGFNMAELKGISCNGTFTTHAGCLIYLDFSNIGLMVSAATQKEQVNCQGRQSYACYILQPMAGAEYFAHWDIIYMFCREALTLVRELWHTYHFSFSCVALVDLVQWHNVLISDLLCAPSLTLSMSIECRAEQQNEKSHSFIAATGLEVCTMHKRMLQIVEEFRGLMPTITVGNYGSTTSVCAGEDDMAARKLSGVLVLRRTVPWDPGGSTYSFTSTSDAFYSSERGLCPTASELLLPQNQGYKEPCFHIRDSWGLLKIRDGKDAAIHIVGELFLPWDPGILRIVFEDLREERNPPLFAKSCSVLYWTAWSSLLAADKLLFKEGGASWSSQPIASTNFSTSTSPAPSSMSLSATSSTSTSTKSIPTMTTTSTKEHQVPWDPGRNSEASAWGQAEFKEGGLLATLCPNGLALGPWRTA